MYKEIVSTKAVVQTDIPRMPQIIQQMTMNYRQVTSKKYNSDDRYRFEIKSLYSFTSFCYELKCFQWVYVFMRLIAL